MKYLLNQFDLSESNWTLAKRCFVTTLIVCCWLLSVPTDMWAAPQTATEEATETTEEESEEPITRMTPELLWRLGRLGNTTTNSDGSMIAYTVRRYDLKENSGTSTVYLHKLGDESARAVLSGWASVGDLQFADSPFGERLYFIGKPKTDDKDIKPQVYSMNQTDGGVIQVTDIEDGASNLKVSPAGNRIAFTVDIKMDDESLRFTKTCPRRTSASSTR